MICAVTAAAASAVSIWSTVFSVAEAVGGACVAIHHLTKNR